MDPDQMASSEVSWSGSTVVLERYKFGFSMTSGNTVDFEAAWQTVQIMIR